MYIVFLFIILCYYAVLSFLAARKINKLKGKVISENIRIKLYSQSIIEGWIPALFVLLICLFSSIGFNDVGLGQLSFNYNIWFNLIIFVIVGVLLALLLYQIILYLVSEEYRKETKEEFAKEAEESHYDAVMNNILIPRTKKEKQLFFGVSLTAGICEELVFRGFLFFIFQSIFPNLSIIVILIIASVIFGIFHSYQGFSGVIKTTLIGVLFGCLYVVTGSIIPGIILHFIVDFSSVFVLSEE